MGDRHYIVTLWRFLQPLLFGQVRTNRTAISDHYDIDSGFFLSFLDPVLQSLGLTGAWWQPK